MNYNSNKEIDFSSFFETSLKLFRTVKQKHDEEMKQRLQEILLTEAYRREQLRKILELERRKILRDMKFT